MEIQDFSMDMFNLKNKVAIITGGNTGIGQGYSLGLAKAGAKIFICAYAKDDTWEKMEKLIHDAGSEVVFFQADLTEKGIAKKIIAACMEAYGRIDILVNNAGANRRSPLLEYKDEDWDAVIDINLNAVYHLSQEVSKVMAKQESGKIINIASMLSFQGGKFVPPYTASKHGVAGLTKAFAIELSEHNIQVNAIAPGYIETDITKAIQDDPIRNKEILDRIPTGRWGKPSDLMGAVIFLASDASSYMSGHILAVDGGWLIR